jgi:hypothetical protein
VSELPASGLAPPIAQAHRVFSLTLALAVQDMRLANNPAEGVELLRMLRAEKRS